MALGVANRTFVYWVDVRPLKPVGSIDEQVYGEEPPFQFAQTISFRFFATSMFNLLWIRRVYNLGPARAVCLDEY